MSDFGDSEPEDAWDPDDPVAELVANLARRIAAVVALRAVDEIIEARLRWLLTDLELVAARIAAGELGRIEH